MQKISARLRKNIHLVLLFLICLLILTSHTFYVIKTGQYPKMDEHSYMELGTAFYRIIQDSLVSAPSKMMQYLIDHPPFRQPLYPLILAISFIPFGLENSYKIALWLNGIFFVTTILSIYFLAKEFLSKTASFLASFIFATYGFPLFYLHFTYSETAASAFISLTLMFLAKSKYFLERRNSIFFAISLMASVMTRWIVGIFLAGPVTYLFLLSILKKGKQRRKSLKNFLLIGFILSPAIVFYILNISYLKDYVGSNVYYGPQWVVEYVGNPHLRNTFSLQSIAYYFKVFEQNTIFFFLLFISGLFLAILRPKKYFFILLAFFVPYAFLTFGSTLKDDRYILPIYPVISIISAIVIDSLFNKKVKIILILLIIVIGLGNFLGASWGKGPLGKEGLKSILLPMPVGHPRYIHFTTVVWPPSKDLTGAKEIIEAIDGDWKKKNSPTIVAFYNIAEINNAIYTRTNYLKEQPYLFSTLEGFPKENRYAYFFDLLQKSNYLLIKTMAITDGSQPEENVVVIKEVNKTLENNSLPKEISLLSSIDVPRDKSKILIYKKNEKISDDNFKAFADEIATVNPLSSDQIISSLDFYLKNKKPN